MTARFFYKKRPVLKNFNDWAEREFEEVERILTNELTARKWDDLRFPAQGIDPVGLSSPPGRNNTDGLLDFDATGIEIIAGVGQMPHAWVQGTPIRPHIHLLYRNSAAGNSVWKFEYNIANVNGDFAGSYTPDTKTHTGPQSTTRHSILAFDEIPMTGYKWSCCILWKLSRIGNDGTNDTFGSDVALIELDFHYQRNSQGSFEEYPS